MTPDTDPTPTPATPAATLSLRDLVARRLDAHWPTFAQAHPNLAAAIDRVRLVEAAVARLDDDPAFRAAMQQADLDEAHLAAALRVVEALEKVVRRLLPG